MVGTSVGVSVAIPFAGVEIGGIVVPTNSLLDDSSDELRDHNYNILLEQV